MTPLRRYTGQTIILTLPGDKSVANVDWLAIYDVAKQAVLGSIIIPEELNVPPSLVTVVVSKLFSQNNHTFKLNIIINNQIKQDKKNFCFCTKKFLCFKNY